MDAAAAASVRTLDALAAKHAAALEQHRLKPATAETAPSVSALELAEAEYSLVSSAVEQLASEGCARLLELRLESAADDAEIADLDYEVLAAQYVVSQEHLALAAAEAATLRQRMASGAQVLRQAADNAETELERTRERLRTMAAAAASADVARAAAEAAAEAANADAAARAAMAAQALQAVETALKDQLASKDEALCTMRSLLSARDAELSKLLATRDAAAAAAATERPRKRQQPLAEQESPAATSRSEDEPAARDEAPAKAPLKVPSRGPDKPKAPKARPGSKPPAREAEEGPPANVGADSLLTGKPRKVRQRIKATQPLAVCVDASPAAAVVEPGQVGAPQILPTAFLPTSAAARIVAKDACTEAALPSAAAVLVGTDVAQRRSTRQPAAADKQQVPWWAREAVTTQPKETDRTSPLAASVPAFRTAGLTAASTPLPALPPIAVQEQLLAKAGGAKSGKALKRPDAPNKPAAAEPPSRVSPPQQATEPAVAALEQPVPAVSRAPLSQRTNHVAAEPPAAKKRKLLPSTAVFVDTLPMDLMFGAGTFSGFTLPKLKSAPS